MPVPTGADRSGIPAAGALGTRSGDGDDEDGTVVLPTPAELEAARDALLPDVLPGPDDPALRVLFCGINPGLVSAATGHHFARPGNRFWPALHAAGFTPRRLLPAEQGELRALGLGLTNVAPRATARADELDDAELVAGGDRLRALVAERAPTWLAVVGIGAYRIAFADRRARLGRQERTLGPTGLWVLPNPSGLNAHHTPVSLADAFAELRAAVEDPIS
jgi:TDG/mug DNA glycosylase family protein